jgi:hypothetical protein
VDIKDTAEQDINLGITASIYVRFRSKCFRDMWWVLAGVGRRAYYAMNSILLLYANDMVSDKILKVTG